MEKQTDSRLSYFRPMKRFLAIGILLPQLAGCGAPEADYNALVTENERLRQEVRDLQAKNQDLELLKDNPWVSIASTELRELTSDLNGETYKLKISFPRGYKDSDERYPVLYVLDAETNFGGVSYITQRLIKDQLIPKILVVGIAYGTNYRRFYELRTRDLTPTVDKHFRPGQVSGGAGDFSTFLEQQVFPFIAEAYRVNENDQAIYGHSFGGLYGMYALLRQPQLFDRYLLLSPSLWWDNKVLFGDLVGELPDYQSEQLFVASGRLEPRIDEHQEEFISILEGKNLENLQIKSEILPNETHRTIFGAGFTNGLRFLYSDLAPES